VFLVQANVYRIELGLRVDDDLVSLTCMNESMAKCIAQPQSRNQSNEQRPFEPHRVAPSMHVVTISMRLVFAVNEVSSESRLIPPAKETFAFLDEIFGMLNSFPDLGRPSRVESWI
jgi:hypothetical protein